LGFRVSLYYEFIVIRFSRKVQYFVVITKRAPYNDKVLYTTYDLRHNGTVTHPPRTKTMNQADRTVADFEKEFSVQLANIRSQLNERDHVVKVCEPTNVWCSGRVFQSFYVGGLSKRSPWNVGFHAYWSEGGWSIPA